MLEPSFGDTFEVLCLQAAGDGRGSRLFGDSLERARKVVRPFMVGNEFPSVYLEFPLKGDPFLDVTVLYSDVDEGVRVDSPLAQGTEGVTDWFARACKDAEGVCYGFEIDASNPELPKAAVHFQPRNRLDLVEPFCEALGEPERARMYLDMAARMPQTWQLSFFGMFRGRPDSPLRVCGYLSAAEKRRCAQDPKRIAQVFDEIGFTAYDQSMLEQAAELLRTTDEAVDFQLDVYPDGSLGPTFAFDVLCKTARTEVLAEAFSTGETAKRFELLESWGIADERWRLISDSVFARGIPVERADGTQASFSFSLMPGWTKVRWHECELKTSKSYLFAKAGVL